MTATTAGMIAVHFCIIRENQDSQRDQYKQCADNKKNHVSSTFAHAFMYGRKLD